MKRPTFGRPKAPKNEKIPQHLAAGKTIPHPLQNPEVSDFVWLGDRGDKNLESAIADLVKPEVLLRDVLFAVVGAHPARGSTPQKRVAAALKELVRAPKAVGRPRSRRYDPYLQYMADTYFRGFYGLNEQEPSLNALAVSALKQSTYYERWSEDIREHRKRRLIERFEAEKDTLLFRLSLSEELEVQRARGKVATAIAAIEQLGVPVKPPCLPTNWPRAAEE